jgi:hypothetical protein
MKHSLEDIRAVDDPEEKLRLLKEFEEEARQEIHEAESLARDGVVELERQKKLEGIEIPVQERLDLESLFGEPKTLEEKAESAVDEKGVEYTVNKDLDKLKSFSEYGTLDESQKEEVARIEGKINAFKYLNANEQVNEKLTASMSIIDNIRKYGMG